MLKIFFSLKAQYLKTEMEYALNFWMMVIAGILMRTLMLGVAYVLFRNVPVIAGWTEGGVYLIMAFVFISEGMSNLVFDGIWSIPALVYRGDMDVILSRPISPLYQILSQRIGLQGVGVFLMGIASMLIALHMEGWLTPGKLLLCLVFIACGAVVRMSTNLISACHIFWMNPGSQGNVMFMVHSVGEYAKYPVNIYPGWMQFILSFIVPFAMIGYVPAMILRGEGVLFHSLLLAFVTAGVFLVSQALFRLSLRKYESMGM